MSNEEKSDKRRIQACLRACYSIPTEALEAGVVGEMVEALKQILGWREIGHAVTLGERILAIEDIARPVIAKAKGESP